jgi:phosphohistidine phosphatase SixA
LGTPRVKRLSVPKQTLKPIAKRLKPAKVVFETGIYEVPERKLWKYVWALPAHADTVLIIGHNPGLHAFALALALALADADSVDHLPPPEGKFPSSALATFRSKADGKICGPAARIWSRSFDRSSLRLPSENENLSSTTRRPRCCAGVRDLGAALC